MAIRIIKATINEANDIAVTGRQSFYDAFHSIFIRKDELQKYLDATYDIFKLANSIESSNSLFFVAYDDEKPIGFAKLKQQSQHQQIQSAKQVELQKIYVLKEYHGTGISQTLLNKVLDAFDLMTIPVSHSPQQSVKSRGLTRSGSLFSEKNP
ncbi:MAG: GNAT family N-acetyltransferase [Sphingobacteriales bacterium]|nr:GNAT family N-acetyltransferase [Sphingobacteriales bacterium]